MSPLRQLHVHLPLTGENDLDEANTLAWWLSPDGQLCWGPYSAAQIQAMLAGNQVSPSVYARSEGTPQWMPLQNVFPQGQQPAPVPNPPAVSSPAPQRSEWTCSLCGGAGWSPCGLCNGTGTKNIGGSVPQYIEIEPRYCIKCNGKGTITCRQCNGTGRI